MADYYKPMKISELKGNMGKVAVIGKVIGKDNGNILIDDESGKVEIASDAAVEKGKRVRAFCSIADGKLKADIMQELNNFDMNLFNKVKEMYEKVGV